LSASFSINIMTHFRSFCSLSLLMLAGSLASGVVLTGCQQDPGSTGSPSTLPLNNPHGGGGSTPAHPELTWSGYQTSHGTTYGAIFVADSDLTHATAVHLSPSGNTWFGRTPTWSSAGSICFSKGGGSASAPDTIEAIDVSVNSSGVPVESNFRVIVGLTSQADRLNNPFWSSTTAVNKIAYTTHGAAGKLWVVSASGGTPSLILSVDTSSAHVSSPLGDPTWSPDDSKLALIRLSASSTTIMILSTSTWTYIDSITVSGTIDGLEWSRTGSTNKLAFSVYASGNYQLYYVDPVTGATPTTSGVAGNYPTWSPNNSAVMYNNAGSMYKNVPFSSTTSLVGTLAGSYSGPSVKWKR
jgi:hypothetical protein